MDVQEAIETTNAAYDSIHKLLWDQQFNHFLFESRDDYQSTVGTLGDAQYVLMRIRQMLIDAKAADEKQLDGKDDF